MRDIESGLLETGADPLAVGVVNRDGNVGSLERLLRALGRAVRVARPALKEALDVLVDGRELPPDDLEAVFQIVQMMKRSGTGATIALGGAIKTKWLILNFLLSSWETS